MPDVRTPSPASVSRPSPGSPGLPGTAAAPARSFPDPGPAVPPTEADLLDFARRTAADAELVASLPLAPEDRTWLRLAGPGGSEAWLIGWPPGTGTGWHDHGGSHGAFVAAAGELTEQSLAARLPTEGWRTLELADDVDRERRLPAGQGRAFGPHHVHEVLNASTTRHAVSVHAYYPPLPLMRRYSRTGQVLRLEQVEQPEEWG
ncbi:cysteine dioxygenase [Streptomyces sp. NA02950]|uniref:cysteine dioxygenase n=1 Tax=Streptomyces sp. NA02950 TaxID=2742137 RepID=UPI00159154F7|nr:cysteine dioxygenase [Streptomyces sp. NA02950]QKV92203.1 cysteine dioxygenase [Streptomyces sp. NA02950]